MLLKRRKGLYGKSHTIWNGWESSVWRFREWHVSCPALLDIWLKLLQNPNLKARLRISFSITKQKNSFFKHFFKLWFSPEVNSDEVYRWKSVSRRSDTWLLCSVVHKRSSCRTQDPRRDCLGQLGRTRGGGSVPPGVHTANIVVMRHVLILGLFCNREYFPAQKWNTIWRSNSLGWVKF